MNMIYIFPYLIIWNFMRNEYERSMIHGLTSTILSTIALWKESSEFEEIHRCCSIAFFLVDMFWILKTKGRNIYFWHHLFAIYMLWVMMDRPYHQYNQTASKIMLIEYANFFTMTWLQDRRSQIKWSFAVMNFFMTRIVYLNVLILSLWEPYHLIDEKFMAVLFMGANAWWFVKMLRSVPY